MKKEVVNNVLEKLVVRYPQLSESITEIESAFELLRECYDNKNKLLVCGSGGSASDSDHIVGELMKSFAFQRKLPDDLTHKLLASFSDSGRYLAEKLQPALRAISLTNHTALNTAFSNDVDPKLTFAQQVVGYGDRGDVLLGISTSGNSEYVINALITAKAMDLKTIGLTGKTGGMMRELCDINIRVEGSNTAEIQELHLPVYHALCLMLELHFFDKS